MAPHSDDVKIPLEKNVYNATTEKFLEEDETSGKKPKSSILLYLSAFSASLTTLGAAAIVVWTSPTIARLQSNNIEENPLGTPVTTFQISLLGGLPVIGSLIGCLFLAKSCDYLGRKKAIMFMSALMLISTIGLAFSKTLTLYYITRFIGGIGMGAVLPCVSVYLSEISEDHNRGSIGCLIGLSFPLGNLYAYVLGPIFSIQTFTLFCAVPYVVNLIAFFMFVPESPSYLAARNHRQDALASLEKLRNKTFPAIEKEYESIKSILEHAHEGGGGIKTILINRGLRKALIISVSLIMIQQLSGVVAILAFAAPLFDSAGTGISGHTVGILIGSIKVCSLFLATAIIEKSGRRPLLLISTLGSGVSMFTLGLFFYLKSQGSPVVPKILWLPVLAVLSYFIFYGVGIGAIPQSIMSELFPSNLRAVAATFSTGIGFLCMVGITIAFPILNKLIGETWCLWTFAACCFIGYMFIYLIFPEIKGKSFLEVQKILTR